jgi:hypothetical protein
VPCTRRHVPPLKTSPCSPAFNPLVTLGLAWGDPGRAWAGTSPAGGGVGGQKKRTERNRPRAGGNRLGGTWEEWYGTARRTTLSRAQPTSDLFNFLEAALRTRYYLSDNLNIRTNIQGANPFFIFFRLFINVGYRGSRCYIRKRT